MSRGESDIRRITPWPTQPLEDVVPPLLTMVLVMITNAIMVEVLTMVVSTIHLLIVLSAVRVLYLGYCRSLVTA
jgi:hypothetical protein